MLNDDALLRAHQYRIYSRPKKGPTLWISREGDVMPEAMALARVRKAIKDLEKLNR